MRALILTVFALVLCSPAGWAQTADDTASIDPETLLIAQLVTDQAQLSERVEKLEAEVQRLKHPPARRHRKKHR